MFLVCRPSGKTFTGNEMLSSNYINVSFRLELLRIPLSTLEQLDRMQMVRININFFQGAGGGGGGGGGGATTHPNNILQPPPRRFFHPISIFGYENPYMIFSL